MSNPLLLVEAPAVEPYRYGLASVAEPAPTSDPHWQLGLQYEQIGTYLAAVAAGACNDAWHVDLPGGVGTVQGLPFSVYAGVDCKSIGYTEEYVLARANAILELGWQHAAENALWTGAGVTGLAPVLNGTGVATTVGTGLAPWAAVGALERALTDRYSGRGVLHATRDLAAYVDRHRQIHERTDGELETALGTRWCFGGGYDGTGPADAAPATDTVWMYATGKVTVRRGDAFVSGGLGAALNRSTNAADVFAEQPTVLTVDGPILAVSVDLTK